MKKLIVLLLVVTSCNKDVGKTGPDPSTQTLRKMWIYEKDSIVTHYPTYITTKIQSRSEYIKFNLDNTYQGYSNMLSPNTITYRGTYQLTDSTLS